MSRLAALASTDVPCGADLLNEKIRGRGNGQSATSVPVPPMSLHEMEKQLIFSVLQHTKGNRTALPRFLGSAAKAYGPSSSDFTFLRTKVPRYRLKAPLEAIDDFMVIRLLLCLPRCVLPEGRAQKRKK